jgi:prepilin-type N-terminal cleavage/methylation domain-containing protein
MTPVPQRSARRAGFTLLELLISLVVGVVILTISTNFATATFRSSRGSDLRDGLNRDARFVGMALSRDLSDAGVAFESAQNFGSVAARGDTVMSLSVPFIPNTAESYQMVIPSDTTDPLPAGGTCGARCIDLVNPGTVPFQLRVGDVAVLQVQSERRLIVLTGVASRSSGAVRRIQWSAADSLFVWPAGLTGGLRLTRTGVAVQRVHVTGWFRDAANEVMMRADRFKADGSLRAAVAARGAESFSARLVFTDGTERAQANGFDADTTNDYDRIVSVVVRSQLKILQRDRTINGGEKLARQFEWRVSPRNLTFERNRAL